MEANFREILPVLVRSGVRFILIGGGAAIAHGQLKRAAGRPRDLDAVAELQALLEERRND